ncbi:glycosyltransferase [Streptomyces sp. NPDC002851]
MTVIVPAHNEETGLPATLESLARQTVPPAEIIVVDDASDDRSGEVAKAHGATVLRPPHNQGSKAKAQNYALPYCATELVLAVDADTVLAPDYIERTAAVFDDPDVAVAAGNVQTRFTRTVWERGRSIEYLFGFHWHRPIQHRAGSPMVCSGCCSVFRRADLVAFGGFPERTIVEDMDYCVPLDHRILTRDGFKYYDELTVGEDVLTLDHKAGTLVWAPLEEVCVFDYDGELYRLEREDGWSVECTPNHRWPVLTATGERTMRTARELRLGEGGGDGQRLPLTGRYRADGELSPRLASLIGRGLAAGRDDATGGTSSGTAPSASPSTSTGASPGTSPPDGAHTEFGSGRERDEALSYLSDEANLPSVVGRLSAEAARAMFDAIVPTDGTPRPQHRGPVREAIQMLALMTGRAAHLPPGTPDIRVSPAGRTLDPGTGVVRRHHRGKVWCPRTAHGTWIVENDGAVIPTGNTWSQQSLGKRAVYVGDAVARAADPETLTYLRKQVWRWMAGFCQNVRLHLPNLCVRKPILALWVLLALFEIVTAPLWWAIPFIAAATSELTIGQTLAWWTAAELLLTAPVLLYAAHRRKLSMARVLLDLPCVYATKVVNLVYAWKALIVELVLVPLRLTKGLTVYEKGRPSITAVR